MINKHFGLDRDLVWPCQCFSKLRQLRRLILGLGGVALFCFVLLWGIWIFYLYVDQLFILGDFFWLGLGVLEIDLSRNNKIWEKK